MRSSLFGTKMEHVCSEKEATRLKPDPGADTLNLRVKSPFNLASGARSGRLPKGVAPTKDEDCKIKE